MKYKIYTRNTNKILISNDLNASLGESTVRFNFTYDSTSSKYGYLNENGTFVPFEEGGTDVSDTTATASDVLNTKYFYTSNGTKTQGSIVQRSATSENVTTTKTYSAGYYPNSWTVTGGINTSDATAYSENIENGYTAYCRGSKITGTATIPFTVQISTTGSLPTKSNCSGISCSTSNYVLYTPSPQNDYILISGSLGVSAIDSELVCSTITNLPKLNYGMFCQANDNYAIVGGTYCYPSGYDNPAYQNGDLVAYNSSKTQSTCSSLTYYNGFTGSNNGAFAICHTQKKSKRTTTAAMYNFYNTSLSKSTLTPSSQTVFSPCRVGQYALFVTSTTSMDCINTSKTVNSISISGVSGAITCYTNSYAFYILGSTAKALDTSLTLQNLPNLDASYGYNVVPLNNKGFIADRYNSANSSYTILYCAYNASFTRTTGSFDTDHQTSETRYNGAFIGKYGIVAGGRYSYNSSNYSNRAIAYYI